MPDWPVVLTALLWQQAAQLQFMVIFRARVVE